MITNRLKMDKKQSYNVPTANLKKAGIIKAIRKVAAKKKRAHLGLREFHNAGIIPINRVTEHFKTWNNAVEKAGLQPYYKSRSGSLIRMQQIAKALGGRCLSKKYRGYEGRDRELRWQCKKGHRWKAIPRDVISGKWCPACFFRHHSILSMQAIAEEKGGKCLSRKYAGYDENLLWQCQQGHQWKERPRTILKGAWCPECIPRPSRYSLDYVQRIARSKGGRCLSEEYRGIKARLQWKCRKNHIWTAKAGDIIRGSWCKLCVRENKSKATVKQSQFIRGLLKSFLYGNAKSSL